MNIRTATEADLTAITAIYNEVIANSTATFDTEPRTDEGQREWFAAHGPEFPILVAERDGAVMGWASLTQWSRRPAYRGTVESSFYVQAEHRAQGVGRALKEALIAEARRLGFHTLLARVAEGSDESLHLNESLGFERIGTMKQVGRKFGRWLDVHVMQLMLD